MEALTNSTGGLRTLVSLNWDRLLYVGVIVVALGIGTWVGRILTQM